QVATTPLTGGGTPLGGSVAGARPDQNTATFDGILITDPLAGGETGGNITMAALPIELIDEFRGTVSNPNETMGRSSGGQFSFATRHGTNSWHGAAYWYHQNVYFNANSWIRNRLAQKNPPLKDNRPGVELGGPIFKDKTFLFGLYEGRRFP